jgi:hypothetical protein
LERYKVVPWGTRKLLNWINYNYKIPVLITENGMSDDGRLLDTDRIKYYRSCHLGGHIMLSTELIWFMVWFIVFNATFNNISVMSWGSVLLVEETGVPGENHRQDGNEYC